MGGAFGRSKRPHSPSPLCIRRDRPALCRQPSRQPSVECRGRRHAAIPTDRHWGPPLPPIYSLEVSLLLGEHPDAEVSVFVGLEGGRDQEVLARGQREAAAHLAQVDEGLGARGRRVALEEVAVEVDASLAAVLTDRRGAAWDLGGGA